MIRTTTITSLATLVLAALAFMPWSVLAQNSQSLSVTPPLFQLSLAPGDVWQSSVKVVNSNAYDLTVFAYVVNFAAQGENGYGTFIPVDPTDTSNATLAQWITMPSGAITIPPESSKDVTFHVQVPKNASPGGHFAAILISTEPPSATGTVAVKTSQVVTSLFFVRIAGDVVESGDIREFSVQDSFLDTPATTFTLRFENKGNVLVQPRGLITITNMWGKERGTIPINNNSHFGNVLPHTIRAYKFDWKGEASLTDIGLYKAIVTLTYGEAQKQNVSSVVYFWVIPIKATLITLAVLLAFVYAVFLMIRLYVRRMLAMAGVDVRARRIPGKPLPLEGDVTIAPSYQTVTAPIRAGANDLKQRLSHTTAIIDVVRTFAEFVATYKKFFAAIAMLSIGLIGIVLYVGDAAKSQRPYQVTIENGPDASVTMNSEEIAKQRLEAANPPEKTNKQQAFTLTVINGTSEPGMAAKVALTLEHEGYRVDGVSGEPDREQRRTAILFDGSQIEEARALSADLGGALLSGRPETASSTKPNITVIVGADQTGKH